MCAMRTQAGRAFIGAAMRKACRMKGINCSAGGGGEGGHGAVADAGGLAIKGACDPKAGTGRRRRAVTHLIRLNGAQLVADRGQDGIIEPLGAGKVIGAKRDVQEHAMPFVCGRVAGRGDFGKGEPAFGASSPKSRHCRGAIAWVVLVARTGAYLRKETTPFAFHICPNILGG